MTARCFLVYMGCVLCGLAWPSIVMADPPAFPGKTSTWNTFVKHDFTIEASDKKLPVIVVVPPKPLEGRPWVWRGEFFGAFADADVALVKAGWHIAYVGVPNLFGSPKAIAAWDVVYSELTGKYELAKKSGLIGLSRGGLYCMNWAAARPDQTLAVYLDNAVCDFKSWPGGALKKLGKSPGSSGEWANLLKAYDFPNDEAAIAYAKNPVDHLEPLAKAKISLLLVYGDADKVVPHPENSELVFDRYTKLGGPVERIVKPGQDHHPHGLKDVTPVVDFFTKAWDAERKRATDGAK
ncbi:MAG: prolyl oligopeptidase family serine peptidase [Pirellulales bacterium]